MNLLFDLLFPRKCVGCNKSGKYFCNNCAQKILQKDLFCPNCERVALGGETHPGCIRNFGLDGLWSLGAYEPPLKSAIQKLKYRWVEELSKDLIELVIIYWVKKSPHILNLIKKDHGRDWIVVSVPLHKSRQNWRGFNQSAKLAEILAKNLGLKYREALIRYKKTRPQVGLESIERRKNIKNAFSLNSKFQIQNSNIILVDDVWTTGSTLKECCYVLKRGGAKTVWAMTVAS